MKIIEGLKSYEVMRLHEEEGKRVAYYDPKCEIWKVLVQNDETPVYIAMRIAEGLTVAIIDESQPSIDWGGVKWEFFEPYGGLPVIFKGIRTFSHGYEDGDEEYTDLCESPLYPWTGGECPVPENCEVTIKSIDWVNHVITKVTTVACEINWGRKEIIAFHLTGRVL